MIRQHGLRNLLATSLVLAGIWMIILPWLAARPHTRRYIDRLDAQGIDPAAMYYTELPSHIFADAPERSGQSREPCERD